MALASQDGFRLDSSMYSLSFYVVLQADYLFFFHGNSSYQPVSTPKTWLANTCKKTFVYLFDTSKNTLKYETDIFLCASHSRERCLVI